MKIKKYLIITIILLILINMGNINANDTSDIAEQTNNTLTTTNEKINNTPHTDILQATDNPEPPLSSIDNSYGGIYNIQLTITHNQTIHENTTLNLHIEWDLKMSENHYNNSKIDIYEDNNIIQTITISTLNYEYKYGTHQTIDTTFNYTLKENYTIIKAVLRQIESNKIIFDHTTPLNLINLNNNMITINNKTTITGTNSITSLQKAIQRSKKNDIIYLNNITILNNQNTNIEITKNLSINGNNATIDNLGKGTLFTIAPNVKVNLINMTFTNTFANYLIVNNGNLNLINTTFTDNLARLINNTGTLNIQNSQIKNTLKIYKSPTTINFENPKDNGLIYNTGKLTLNNTKIENITITQINTLTQEITWIGVIINFNELTILNTKFTNINHRAIYNTGTLKINNTIFNNIKHKGQQISILNPQIYYISTNHFYNSFRENSISINASEKIGPGIYNTGTFEINNSVFNNFESPNGGIIYNINTGIIESSIINNSKASEYGGWMYTTGTLTLNKVNISNIETTDKGGIYNTGTLNIKNSTITKSTVPIANHGTYYLRYGQGSVVYNLGTLNITNSTIAETTRAIFNENQMTITQTNLINNTNNGGSYVSETIVKLPTGQTIYNSKTATATISNCIIKGNIAGSTGTTDDGINYNYFNYGLISNYGIMNITSTIFDNNTAQITGFGAVGNGAANIYNSGKITVLYCFLVNSQTFTAQYYASPATFLFNNGNCYMNYNYFSLTPDNKVIRNANINYYFTSAFDKEYYPIKLNQTQNITVTIGLSNGKDVEVFTDWDKLPQTGFNTTITTINETGQYQNISLILNDYYTFNFNYTQSKGEYTIYTKVLNYVTQALVDVGKEFANMNVVYNNITYHDGNNITFHINITGKTKTPTGNVTLTLNNNKYIINLTNGYCNFTVPELKPGNYTMRIDYNGDEDYFKIFKQKYNFTVHKIPIEYTLNITEALYGETSTITITIAPETALLYADLYIDGTLLKEHIAVEKTATQTYYRAAGTYNITAIIKSDEYYEGGQASALMIVKKWQTNMKIESKDINSGEDAIINITINPEEVRGKAIISINDKNETIWIEDTVTSIRLTNLADGTYHVKVRYLGDYKYQESVGNTTFSVSKKTTKLNVNITTNDDLTGYILVQTDSVNCTGPVGLYINNDPRITLNLTEGIVNFTVKFKRGSNLIYVYYLGDEHYSYATWNTTRNIEGKAIITTNTTEYTEPQINNYTINLKDTDGNPYEYTQIQVTFKNQTVNLITDSNGYAYLPIIARAGNYNIQVTYKNTTVNDTITIKPTKINITVKDILAGEDEIITVQLPYNATGNITIHLDNQTVNKTLINGLTNITFENLKLGLHNLTIIYSGDKNYINQTINTQFSIKNSLSWITVEADNITYGEALKVKINVISGATGNVTVTITNQTKTVNLNNTKTITFNNITGGEKTINAKYNGDNVYQGSNTTLKINVKKATPTLTLTTSELAINQNIEINATLNTTATGNITFHIQGLYSPRNRTITNGISTWLISPLHSGSYNLIATYSGDGNYESTTKNLILTLNQTKTTLTINIPNIREEDDLVVYATLTDENNNKLTDNLTLEINNNYYKIIVVNGEGVRNLGEFKSGNYGYTVTYSGTYDLSMAISQGNVNIQANEFTIVGNTNIIDYYGANKDYTIQVLNHNTPVESGNVITLTLNGQTLNLITNSNGEVSFKLNLNPGTYSLTAIYKDTQFTSKITIKNTLITSNKSVKKAKTIKYTAKLLNSQGKALKNKKITFKINKKTYKAKTNKNGVATIKIKNLKAGKYTIKTSYAKLTNINTIKIKK